MTKYIQHIPKPLLEDILNNQCIPIIGAGFSLNSDLPNGKIMPLWEGLGREIAGDLLDYEYTNALDAISAYSYEYSRSKLIEKLTQLLHVSDAKPSKVHTSFCSIPFDTVCTTNFDFLLEKGYDNIGKYCLPIIDEEQLSIGSNQLLHQNKNVILLKLHGDLHHPNRMVATEQDYDAFLEKYPLVSTYLANLLITRTPLFIGYSLEDSDFRQVWQIISNRLGELRRPAYVISIGAKQVAVNKYRRRGVNVINLEGNSYREVFETLFEEIREYWIKNLPSSSAFNEQTLAELSLPADATNRLCYVAVPNAKTSYYKSYVFPVIEAYGFSPLSTDELPEDNISARITAIIEKSDMIIFDAEDEKSITEIRNILEKRQKPLHLLVLSTSATKALEVQMNKTHHIKFIVKQENVNQSDTLLNEIEEWLTMVSESIMSDLSNEPERLLSKQEYRAAVISVFTLLESELRKVVFDKWIFDKSKDKKYINRNIPLTQLLKLALDVELIDLDSFEEVKVWLQWRHRLVHEHRKMISQSDASQVVQGVNQLILKVKRTLSPIG